MGTTHSILGFDPARLYFRVKKAVKKLLFAPPHSSAAQATLALFPEVTPAQVQAAQAEFRGNRRFFDEANRKMVETRNRDIVWKEDWHDFLYLVIRFGKPRIVVETGVFDGLSTAVMLQALHDNGSGQLISIDLPAQTPIPKSTDRMQDTTLPPGCAPGWVVPDYLRGQFRLEMGDSKTVLPQLLAENPEIDIFLHDSLHTFEHQSFEYQTAWPHLTRGGLLLSDDIFWSQAFHKFCKRQKIPYMRIGGFGIARK